MSTSLLRNVSDTALWVASCRAEESARPDALFDDPWAGRLAGERGAALAGTVPASRDVSWAISIRTVLFDQVILHLLRDGADAVLNLAAGLDTRPYRLDLPASLLWVEADLPGIFDFKEEALAAERPVCRLERVRADLADAAARQAVIDEVAARCRKALVISEGLMVYLRAEDAVGLARDLHRAGSLRWWLMDLDSPRLLRYMARAWGDTFARAGADMRFAPEEGPEFFRPHGWKVAESYSFLEESRRLGRPTPAGRLWHWFGRFAPAPWRREILRLATAELLERA